MKTMKVGDLVKASPRLTGKEEWVEGFIIDIEDNPFKGIVIYIRDEHGVVTMGEERYFEPVD